MPDALQRCSRWRRIRATNCSFRSGNGNPANRIDSWPRTAVIDTVLSNRCSGIVAVLKTRNVIDPVNSLVPSAIDSGATGSKAWREGRGVGVVMQSILPAGTAAGYSNVTEPLL